MMRKEIRIIVVIALLMGVSIAKAQDKKRHKIVVSREIDASPQKLWKVVGEDYGAIANSHPKIVKSEYKGGSLKGGEGVERVCYLNDSKSKYIQEKQLKFDPENFTFIVQVSHVEGLPLDPENSVAVYRVEPISATKSRVLVEFEYRTQPAFLGGISKGKFTQNLSDYLIAVEHHVKTGENVNQENFKIIKQKYQ